MSMKNQKGFTLIELLVVIAIIGLLSTLAVISLSAARGKARDAQRVSDVRQMAAAIDIENANQSTVQNLTTCDGSTAALKKTTACTGPGDISQFSRFKDPSWDGSAACIAGATNCSYSVCKGAGTYPATTGDYQICFFLEAGAGSLGVGAAKATTGGVLTTAACTCT